MGTQRGASTMAGVSGERPTSRSCPPPQLPLHNLARAHPTPRRLPPRQTPQPQKAGKGPWIMADMENALWGANVVDSEEPSINHDYVHHTPTHSFLLPPSAPPPLLTHTHTRTHTKHNMQRHSRTCTHASKGDCDDQGGLWPRPWALGHQGGGRAKRHAQDLLGRGAGAKIW